MKLRWPRTRHSYYQTLESERESARRNIKQSLLVFYFKKTKVISRVSRLFVKGVTDFIHSLHSVVQLCRRLLSHPNLVEESMGVGHFLLIRTPFHGFLSSALQE